MFKFIAAALVALTASNAWANNCGPTPFLIYQLVERYGERVQDVYERPHKSVPDVTIIYEVWANPETGTWTFTGRGPDGVLCVFAVGEDYAGQRARDFFDTDI